MTFKAYIRDRQAGEDMRRHGLSAAWAINPQISECDVGCNKLGLRRQKIVARYLLKCNACDEAKKAGLALWREYKAHPVSGRSFLLADPTVPPGPA
jgi:hypothetical protein